MPTYDYECKACGETVEISHGIKEPPRKECPSCGKKKLVRLIGPGSGLIFKGSGFYITDYRSPDYQARAKADAGSTGAKSEPSSGESSGSKEPKPKEPTPPKESALPKESAPPKEQRQPQGSKSPEPRNKEKASSESPKGS